MREKKIRKMQADIEMAQRCVDARRKILDVLRPMSERKARRVLAAAAILLGHGAAVGFYEPGVRHALDGEGE